MAELFSNDAATTLNGGINNSVTSLVVTSATKFKTTGNFRIKIDDEIMLVTSVSGSTFTVTRAQENTTAVLHANGAPVTSVLTEEALNQFRADNILTGSLASLPSNRKAGIIYLPNDSIYVYRDNGSIWTAFGPINCLTPPIDANYSWVNQGTATVDATSGGVYLNAPGVAGGQNMRIREKSAPATPYKVEMYIQPLFFLKADMAYGACFRESGTSKIVSLFFQATGSPPLLQSNVFKHSSATVVASGYSSTTFYTPVYPNWLRLSDNGTTLGFDLSPDGRNWWSFFTVARTDYFTTGPDKVGVFAYPANFATPNFNVAFNLMHWKET